MGVRNPMSQDLVLECLKKAKRKLSVKEIAKLTGLDHTSIHQATMKLYKKWGMLRREEVTWREIYWEYKE